ncbi:MAG: DUF1275 family protein [Microthrixaceae bacterium]
MTKHSDATAVRLPETMAVLLAAVSGFVDAFVYLRVYPVFTANQSGNLVLAGIGWARASGAWRGVRSDRVHHRSGLVIAAFDRDRVAGRAPAGCARHRGGGAHRPGPGGHRVRRGRSVSHVVDAPVVLMVAATACAMGIQESHFGGCTASRC